MPHDIELELLTRPANGTAVSLVASRLRLALTDTRNGLMHDDAVRAKPDAGTTVAPPGSLDWCSKTDAVWNRVEWCERFGNAPIAFAVRTRLPDDMGTGAAQRFARELAAFVAGDLAVPVTWTLAGESARWPMRDGQGTVIQLCFPTRILALNDGSNAVGDRSGMPSGFAGRLAMVSNPHLATQFTRRVALEVARLEKASAIWEGAGKRRFTRRADVPFPFDDVDLPSTPVAVEPTENPATHPLLVRLRREAPRSMSLPDLRDFEFAMGMARTVEDTLADVTAHAGVDRTLQDDLARTKTSLLDHLHLLDHARRRRESLKDELAALDRRKRSLWVLIRGAMAFVSAARQQKVVELRLAQGHVEELKTAIGRIRNQERRLASDCEASATVLATARRELRDAVKGLHAADPRVLQHLVTIVDDAQRAHMKAAMSGVVPAVTAAPSDGSGGEDTRAGPPAKPARGARPR